MLRPCDEMTGKNEERFKNRFHNYWLAVKGSSANQAKKYRNFVTGGKHKMHLLKRFSHDRQMHLLKGFSVESVAAAANRTTFSKGFFHSFPCFFHDARGSHGGFGTLQATGALHTEPAHCGADSADQKPVAQ
jgi:hypothetical protein